MILWDWQCLDCLTNSKRVVYPDLERPPEICEICDGTAFQKVPAAPAVRFKGQGFTPKFYPGKGEEKKP